MTLHLVPRGLLYVEAVAEHGSIQAASRVTGISASAIDRQIKLIEDRLGALLFDRQPRGMVLSPAGEMFVMLAQRWHADEARILSDVKRMQGVDFGHIRLATMDSLVNGVVPQFLGAVARQYPRVRVDVEIDTPDGVARSLEEGTCELALCFNMQPTRAMHVLWRAELPLYCVAAPQHPLAGHDSVTLKDVRAHAIAVQSRALSIRRMLEARHSWMFETGPPPVVTNSLQLMKQLVLTGDRVALTSEMDVAPELLDGRMVAVSVTGAHIATQTISLAVNAGRTLPRIATVIAGCLAHHAADTLDRLRTARGPQRVTEPGR